MRSIFLCILLFVFGILPVELVSGSTNWPTWRYDAARKGFAEITVPSNPSLLWTRQLEEPKRCWPFQFEDYFTGGNPDQIGKLSFDISYEPVIGEGKLFVPSMVSDRVTAYSATSGEEMWRYYVGGPVRFAPVYDSGKLYFTSDDGFLYCLDAETGAFLWNYHGSYSSRMVLGNERIISMWPARGGPVLKDGIIYFAAGVMPFEGIFVHAVDANNGEKLWTNSTSGMIWNLHQHGGAYSYGGPSPQGYLAISGDRLIVPGGRTPPAVFDRETGELLYFNQATVTVGKGAGGYRVFASGDWFFNHGMLYALEDGAQFGPLPGDVITREAFIGASGNLIVAHKSELKTVEVEIEDRLQRQAIAKRYETEELWKAEMDNLDRLFFKTRSHYAVSRNGGRTASLIEVTGYGIPGKVVWEYDIDGEIWSMLAGDNKLYVVTREGKIYCFGTPVPGPVRHYVYKADSYMPYGRSAEIAGSIIEKTGIKGGYGLILGGEDSDLIKALVDKSSMHFAVIEPDRAKAALLKSRFDKMGIYGKRVAVLNDFQATAAFLPYIYELLVVKGNGYTGDKIITFFNSLRPYGGTACFIGAGRDLQQITDMLDLENGELLVKDDFALLTRQGALPGSGQWTHQYGSAANRTYSDDNLVKPPLGTLWFGGPSNQNTLPRHGLGPVPQVAGGRQIILGVETISARCVYTGRELWVKKIPGIGHPFTNLEGEKLFTSGREVFMHSRQRTGSNFIGSPYVSLEDVIYVIDRCRLLSLDPSTGELITEYHLPQLDVIETMEFGHILVSNDYLIATIDIQIFDEGEIGRENWNATSSSILLVIDRQNGDLKWTKKAESGFRHNAIVAGNSRLFAIDGFSDGVIDILRRRGIQEEPESRLFALDLSTGKELWSVNEDIFGTWLGYYEDKDVLIQAGRYGGLVNLEDEPRNTMFAHCGESGKILWKYENEYKGPLNLHPDMIIMSPASRHEGAKALEPLTGNIVRKEHPILKEEYDWYYQRYYGCGLINSSRHLITFRSGTAGYADLLNFEGTGNFGGFRSGCTNNLIVADGILNAPDHTRTCTCSYPLQTSVGLTHMPFANIEAWTLNRLPEVSKVIHSLGINFGAPGNRREDGVLWLEYPKVYGAGPDLPLTIESISPGWFRNHATWIENDNEKYNWVGSYGIEGITSMMVDLVPHDFAGDNYYDITLYFTEPEDIAPGERIFDVSIQGKKVLENFDIVRETGGTRRVFRIKFTGIEVKDTLKIEFADIKMSPVISGVKIMKRLINSSQ